MIGIILIIGGVIFVLNYINRVISPRLVNYAELEVRKISSIVINRTVSQHVQESLDIENFFIVTKNNNNEIMTIDYNPVILNKLLTDITSSLQLSLKNLEEGRVDRLLVNDDLNVDYKKQMEHGVVVELSSSQIFNNFLFSNLGPKIPVRLKLLGDVESNISSRVTNYGINNALIEVFLSVRVNERVILPVSTSNIVLEVNVPISMKLLKGTVPSYYLNGINKGSSILSLPIE